MRLHALCGLPRSGTTLLGNVLAQHPDVTVHGTSPIPQIVEKVQDFISTAPETQSDLAQIPGAYDHYLDLYRGMIEGFYAHVDTSVVFDKGRGWIMHHALLRQLYPSTRIVAVVRDPRDVIASIERQHAHSAAFTSPLGPTLEARTAEAMGPQGMVGGPCRYIEDAIKLGADIVYVRYETFVADPIATMSLLADRLELDPHPWDFVDVVNVATDLDALYRGKYPHDGSGPVKAPASSWREVIDPHTAERIAVSYPLFMQTFGYTS